MVITGQSIGIRTQTTWSQITSAAVKHYTLILNEIDPNKTCYIINLIIHFLFLLKNFGDGRGSWTPDLKVMSLASYHLLYPAVFIFFGDDDGIRTRNPPIDSRKL